MPEILKNGKVVGTFTYDPETRRFDLVSKDMVIQRISKSVPGIKGKYIPEHDAMISYAVDLHPGDPDYAFHFLSVLKSLGYEVSM